MVKNFEKEFSLVSYLFSTITIAVWFVKNEEYHHIIISHDIFTSTAKEQRCLHVELGDNARYVMEGIGSIQFWLGT